LSAPALGLQTGPPDPRVLPKDDPARADFDAIEHDLGATRAMPYVVTVVANHGTLADERLQELARFERELARDPDTAEVLGPATVARRVAALATAPEKLQEASAAASDGQRAAAKLNNGLAQASGGAGDVVGGLRAAANGSAKLRAGGARAEGAAGQIHNGVELARNGAAALRGGLARAVAGA